MPSLRSALMLMPLMWSMTTPAFAQDEDLDDLPDDVLGGAESGGVKVKSAPAADDDADPDFDFGDDPDWDAGPAPLPAGDDFGDDPPEDLPAGGDAFFEDDPPDDLIRPAPVAADPLDADPPETGGAVAPAAPKLGLGLDTKGKAPLGDHYAAAVVGRDLDAIVVELPVLVAVKPADFEADYWLITEVMVEDRKVAESRHLVTRASVADMGPTVVWSKSHVPVLERAGSVELKLSQQAGEAAAKPLFTKTVDYAL